MNNEIYSVIQLLKVILCCSLCEIFRTIFLLIFFSLCRCFSLFPLLASLFFSSLLSSLFSTPSLSKGSNSAAYQLYYKTMSLIECDVEMGFPWKMAIGFSNFLQTDRFQQEAKNISIKSKMQITVAILQCLTKINKIICVFHLAERVRKKSTAFLSRPMKTTNEKWTKKNVLYMKKASTKYSVIFVDISIEFSTLRSIFQFFACQIQK